MSARGEGREAWPWGDEGDDESGEEGAAARTANGCAGWAWGPFGGRLEEDSGEGVEPSEPLTAVASGTAADEEKQNYSHNNESS